MALETASWISQLDPANPVDTDPVGEGNDHIQQIKTVLQNSFPSSSTAAVIPNMSGQNGKYLTTNGTDSSWGTITQTLEGLSDTTISSPSTDQALVYNGAAWVNTDVSAVAPYTGIAGVQVYTGNNTWTKATREAALGVTIKRVIVEVQGGGGSGDNQTGTPRSGAAGGYVRKLIDVSSISSATITVGTGGAYIGGITTSKSTGGNSIWDDGTNTLTAQGGQANGISTAIGGTATGGDLNIPGSDGESNGYSKGASTIFGGGGIGYFANTFGSGGTNAKVYGSGGGCGGGTNGSTGGGAGGAGIVIVWEIAG